MATPIPFTGAVEGAVDDVILRSVMEAAGRGVGTVYIAEGKQNLVRRLPGFNAAAQHAPWVVLIDLNSTPCAPTLLVELLPQAAGQMRCRVVVRAAEAWLLGDAERFSAFFGVAARRIPTNPEAEASPKETVVNLARSSRRRAIREDMVPVQGGGRSVGPAFAARLIEFVLSDEHGWRPMFAAERCDSLARCLQSLGN